MFSILALFGLIFSPPSCTDANGVKSKCTDKFLAYKDCKSKIYVAKQKERDEVFFGKK
jgi:hypothetical protein